MWDIYPNTFSGGEKLRLNLAQAMVKAPRLLLLDEPTASLDNNTKKLVKELLLKMKAEGTSMIGIFHDLEFMDGLCDHVYNISNGSFSEGVKYTYIRHCQTAVKMYRRSYREQRQLA